VLANRPLQCTLTKGSLPRTLGHVPQGQGHGLENAVAKAVHLPKDLVNPYSSLLIDEPDIAFLNVKKHYMAMPSTSS
jgi:hypothetical protein